MTLDHYQGIHARQNLDYNHDTGTNVLYDAYHEAVTKDLRLKEQSFLFEEVIFKKYREYMAQVNLQMKTAINFCTAAFINPEAGEVNILARAPGFSYC